MFDVKKMVEEITSKKEIKNISFTGVGGVFTLVSYAPYYYVMREGKNVTTSYTSSQLVLYMIHHHV